MPSAIPVNVTKPGLEELLADFTTNAASYRNKAKKVSMAMRMAGGLSRATELVLSLLEIGDVDHLMDFNTHWNVVQRSNLDILLIFVLVIWLFLFLLRWCCSCLCGCCIKKTDTNKLKQE
jgi:hypothetical protein